VGYAPVTVLTAANAVVRTAVGIKAGSAGVATETVGAGPVGCVRAVQEPNLAMDRLQPRTPQPPAATHSHPPGVAYAPYVLAVPGMDTIASGVGVLIGEVIWGETVGVAREMVGVRSVAYVEAAQLPDLSP
jgi:hypothetical protein